MKERKLEIVNYILLVICFAVGFYLAAGMYIFSKTPEEDIRLWALIAGPIILLLSLGALLFINIKNKRYKPNHILIGLLGLVFVAGLFTIIFIKDRGIYQYPGADGNPCEFEYHITPILRFTYIVELFAYLVTGFMVFDIVHQVVDGRKLLKLACYFILIVVGVLTIISYIKDFQKYIEVIKYLTKGEIYVNAVASVFESKNNYAYVLTLAIFASLILHYHDKKWYWLAICGFVYLNMFFTLCKWLLFLDAIAILAYLAYRFFASYKENKKRNLITLAAIAGSLVILSSGLITILAVNNKLDSLIELITKQNDVDTLDARLWIWKRAVLAIENGNWITGAGFNLFGQLLFRYNTYDVVTQFANNTRSAHNGYLQYIGDGGIILLLVALIIAGMLIYLCIKNMKIDRDLMVISLIILVFSLIYMIIESGTIFLPRSMENAALTVLATLPILTLTKEKAN